MKKILSLTLTALLLLALFGCTQQAQPLDTGPSESVSAGTVETTEATEPTTGPTEPATTPATDPTDPSEPEQPTEVPQETESTEQPSEPETNHADPAPTTEPTQPATEATTPPQTEPAETQPPATEPAETQPQETTPAETQPPVTEPPATEPPETEPPAEETETFEVTEEFKRQVAQYAIQYLNQYRAEEGVHALTYLSGMTKVAQYRAYQLITLHAYDLDTQNAHTTAEKREALAYYRYGRWMDATLAGLDASYSYYEADSAEAICGGFRGSTAEALGASIAKMIRTSGSHWSYIKSGEYSYIGVGVEYREDSQYGWYACVMVGSVNYG